MKTSEQIKGAIRNRSKKQAAEIPTNAKYFL